AWLSWPARYIAAESVSETDWASLTKKRACSLRWLPGLPPLPNQVGFAPLPVKMTPVPVTEAGPVRMMNPPPGSERLLGMNTTGSLRVPLMTTAPLLVMSQRGLMRTTVPAPTVTVAPALTVMLVVMWMRELSGHDTLPLRVPETCIHAVTGVSSIIVLFVARPWIEGE